MLLILLDNEKSLDLALKEGLQILENFSKEEKGELTAVIIVQLEHTLNKFQC